jgi:PhnB protein
MPDVVPFLGYENPGAAADWLCAAFGFEELERIEYEGKIGHVTLRSGEGRIFLGSPDGYINPRHLQERVPLVAQMYAVPWIVDGVWAAVADLELVIDTLARTGGRVISGPEDGPGGRLVRVEDLEGHRWMLVQRDGARSAT